MKKLGGLAVAAALAATACSHPSSSQAQAEAGRAPVASSSASDMPQPSTPVYPRAQLVALPGNIPPAPSPAVPSDAAETNTAPTATEVPASATTAETPPASAAPAEPSSTEPATNVVTTAFPLTDTPAPVPAIVSSENVQVVVLQTTFGRMVLQLDDFAAPKTCANFRNLVSSGFYNGTVFHRVIPHFVIQGGDPNSKTENRSSYGQGGPGYTLPPEIKLSHDRGAVAMARLPDTVNPQRDSNGSQFYICVEACPSLDDQYTVFAHVIQGMDVAERIAAMPRDNRDDPLTRMAMDVRLEPKDQALQERESPAASH